MIVRWLKDDWYDKSVDSKYELFFNDDENSECTMSILRIRAYISL